MNEWMDKNKAFVEPVFCVKMKGIFVFNVDCQQFCTTYDVVTSNFPDATVKS